MMKFAQELGFIANQSRVASCSYSIGPLQLTQPGSRPKSVVESGPIRETWLFGVKLPKNAQIVEVNFGASWRLGRSRWRGGRYRVRRNQHCWSR